MKALISFFLILFINVSVYAFKSNIIKSDLYIVEALDENSEEMSEYFYINLKYRTTEDIIKHKQDSITDKSKSNLFIKIKLDKTLDYSYKIEHNKNQILLKGKSKTILIWLYYQFYKELSKVDSRINALDIAPSIISFNETQKNTFAYNYREPHYQPNLKPQINRQYATNNVETDWGIWGHNLGKVLKKANNENVFSIINNKRNKNQICFSSPETYNFIENYITDQFGNGFTDHYNFVIAPNDNKLVCNDKLCLQHGNTETNTTPSVLLFVKKLAKKFPKHNFYLLDYNSFKSIPSTELPPNIGVIISSINLPVMKIANMPNSRLANFEKRIKEWSAITSNILIWEYTSNFDDYLSPFPCLTILKDHLKHYKSIGVNGVFCNASGYDYSTFEDLKTYISSALLINPDLDIKPLIASYFEQFYPVSGKLLTNYYLTLEQSVPENKMLNIYSGINEMKKTFFNETSFLTFYEELTKIIPYTKREEYVKLKKIAVGLSFTYLQNALDNTYKENGFVSLQANGNYKVNETFINAYHFLKDNHKAHNIQNFKEFNGKIESYLEELQKVILNQDLNKNKLLFKQLKVQSKLDEDYKDISILTNGVPGLINDYHRGWLFCSLEDLVLTIPTEEIEDKNLKIEFSFLENEALKLLPPKKIEIYINNKVVETIINDSNNSYTRKRKTNRANITVSKNDVLKIKLIRNEKYKKFAIDEIYIF